MEINVNENKNIKSRRKVAKNKRHSRGRKINDSVESSRYSKTKMGKARKLSPLAELINALRKEKIRLQMVGMSAAIMQGVPATTLDVDLWLDLPERSYMRVLNLCVSLGCSILRPTVVLLKNESLVNFCYQLNGVGDFKSELKKCKNVRIDGVVIPVMSLKSIFMSKKFIGRPKDIAHLDLIKKVLKCQRSLS